MIYKQKGSRYYAAKFLWKGQLIRKSTRATDKKTARTIEGKMRAELARGNWGIFERKPAPTLAQFLERDFLRYVDGTAAKPSTATYYHDGVKRLLASDLASVPLDQITNQHAGQFAARFEYLSPSTVNCGLRTLRRAMNLAVEWGKLERMTKIKLATGERQRERVLTEDEATRYLAVCPQPWKDVATVMLGCGARPGELYSLRWEHVLLNGEGGLIHIVRGKSKAARRLLPMVPAVYQALKARHEAQGCPAEGWVFPSGSRSGHLEESIAKKYHSKALAILAEAHKENPREKPEVKPFEPYCLRHTALTWLAPHCDVFTLARIAGHSDIRITQRYVHPQEEAVEAAFQRLASGGKVVRDGGQSELALTTR
jgi:integrase